MYIGSPVAGFRDVLIHDYLKVNLNRVWGAIEQNLPQLKATGEPFLNLFNAPNLSPEDEFAAFGTSMKKVALALFRINGGKQGYNIANILDKNITIVGLNGRM